eukprot:547494-Prymnesium_polylepis.2
MRREQHGDERAQQRERRVVDAQARLPPVRAKSCERPRCVTGRERRGVRGDGLLAVMQRGTAKRRECAPRFGEAHAPREDARGAHEAQQLDEAQGAQHAEQLEPLRLLLRAAVGRRDRVDVEARDGDRERIDEKPSRQVVARDAPAVAHPLHHALRKVVLPEHQVEVEADVD